MALTDTGIKKATPKEKAYRMSDSGGRYLWVTPSGGKLWQWAYRFEAKEKLMSLGKYPAVSLALARERHSKARKLLATKTDPMALRKVEQTAERVATENSFASIAAGWLTRRRLSSNILPSLGQLQITEIQALDVVAMVRTIEARGARDVAKRAMETTGQIFRYAIAHGYASRNPAKGGRRISVSWRSGCQADNEQ
ncbi:MAG: integrase arm-type DNA-binding domain-containing protein [Edaphobacter sp.]